jgi:hypothetical protein
MRETGFPVIKLATEVNKSVTFTSYIQPG